MIIITGATGHIGNVVVKKLVKQGYQVGIVTHKRSASDIFQGYDLTEYNGSTNDINFLEKIFTGSEAVIHLAAKISIQQGQFQELHEINVVGTRNVMQAALKAKVPKVVYTSSVHALLEKPIGEVMTEIVPDDANDVLGDYAKSKVMAYHEVIKAFKQGLNVTILFPAGVIGPFDYKPSQIGQMIKNILAGKRNYYFDGKYNYVDVRDVADGIITALDKGEAGVGYSLTGEIASVADFYQIISDELKQKTPVIKINSKVAYAISFITDFIAKVTKSTALFTPYSYKVLQSNCQFSNAKAVDKLGFKPRTIKDSLIDAVKWHQGNEVSLD